MIHGRLIDMDPLRHSSVMNVNVFYCLYITCDETCSVNLHFNKLADCIVPTFEAISYLLEVWSCCDGQKTLFGSYIFML
jgi:hypothetical protein